MRNLLTLPPCLPPSARVDILHVSAGTRPVARLRVQNAESISEVVAWARRCGLYSLCDEDGFVAVSFCPSRVRRVMTVDRSPEQHARSLGLMLGYPWCCCRAAERIGEDQLDAWAKLMSNQHYVGIFGIINPDGYELGVTLVSHIPCSSRCVLSLKMAKILWRTLRKQNHAHNTGHALPQ